MLAFPALPEAIPESAVLWLLSLGREPSATQEAQHENRDARENRRSSRIVLHALRHLSRLLLCPDLDSASASQARASEEAPQFVGTFSEHSIQTLRASISSATPPQRKTLSPQKAGSGPSIFFDPNRLCRLWGSFPLTDAMESCALAPTRSRNQRVHLTANATWTQEEDRLLSQLASESETTAWSSIVKYFPNKTAPQLAGRWEKVLNPKLVKGSWTREEDEAILDYVKKNGDKDWAKLALQLDGRTGKQCRERFKNHLDPKVLRAAWTEKEDALLIELHAKFGNSWTKMSGFFEGRTDNCIKNRWNSTLKKRLERMEKGEPLVMKRGRKPKGYYDAIPKPEISGEASAAQHQLSSDCSSPVHLSNAQALTLVEIAPFVGAIPHFMMKSGRSSRQDLPSLEENRLCLHQMLAALA